MNASAIIGNFEEHTDSAIDIAILEGQLHAEQSVEPVLHLLNDLISYHNKRNFSHQERFGKPDQWSEQMLISLEAAYSNARDLIEQSRAEGIPLEIESFLKIKLASEKSVN